VKKCGVHNRDEDPCTSKGIPMRILYTHETEPGAVPDVSVLISLYNYRHFIFQCLESVREQTLQRIELIVCDDCSKDGGPALVEGWLRMHCGRFTRCSLMQNESNRGLAQTRNGAIECSQAPFVFILDADNMLFPHCLERLWSVLGRCDAAFAYGALEVFGAETGLMGLSDWRPDVLHRGNVIDAMVMHRKSDIVSVGCFTSMKAMGWEDFDLWFKYAKAGKFGVRVHEILARYRVHSTSMLSTTTNLWSSRKKLWKELRSAHPEFFETI
jgi:glycosyltransferase involved in cell wall biosynthesis